MTLHPNITSEILAALGDIFARNQYAEQIVDARLKANRKWGARDRRLFASSGVRRRPGSCAPFG